MHQPRTQKERGDTRAWTQFTRLFLTVFCGGLAGLYLFILLVDPYDVFGFSLPIERRIVSISQRYMYPQIVNSGRFDSLVVGTSTSRLLDPEILNRSFGTRFANLAMDSGTAWEQQQIVSLFQRRAGPPKALIVGLDLVWCDGRADENRITPRGFPDWLYDDVKWNDLLYMLNTATLEIAGRMAGYAMGLYRERMRYDGFQVFVPPEEQYDLARARTHIWPDGKPAAAQQNASEALTATEREAQKFPALGWLDAMLASMPASSEKVLAFMPVHVAAQPVSGSRGAAIEQECKDRIVAIARARGATVADWRIPSPLTTEDSNYWDPLHYRLPIAHAIARELGGPIRSGQAPADAPYRILNSR